LNNSSPNPSRYKKNISPELQPAEAASNHHTWSTKLIGISSTMGPLSTSVETIITENQVELNHLIIVCCHAIYLGPPSPSSSLTESWTTTESQQPGILPSNDENNWLIESFQKGETATYIGHVEAGVQALAADDHAILVFSGGATKPDKTEKTEGDGYLVRVL